MRNTIQKILFGTAIIAFFFSLSADTGKFDTIKAGLGFGFGLQMPSEEFGAKPIARVLIPIQMYQNFRFEPLFSMDIPSLMIDVGVGMFYTHPFKSTMIITGARLYFSLWEGAYYGGSIEPLISGEYFFSKVSIAVEIAARFHIFRSDLQFNVLPTFYFRWYFL